MKKKMTELQAVYHLGRLVFTTREIASLTQSDLTNTTQRLRYLEKQKIIAKITHGIWGFVYDRKFTPFLVIPFLNSSHRAYLSFLSALNFYGVISQIPQTMMVASTAHTKTRNTQIGSYEMHQLSPDFFTGFDWHADGDFLIAEPEKALADCLYLAGRKKRQFAHFPELDLDLLNRAKTRRWLEAVKDEKLRCSALKKLEQIFKR